MVANRNKGTKELLAEIIRVAEGDSAVKGVKLNYGREIEKEISLLAENVATGRFVQGYSPRWAAVKLIEGDSEIIRQFEEARGA
jgi:ferrous iron transport protein B